MMLREGLERHSLHDLVLPVLSIDEYESKIDDRKVIVVGFFVNDYDPGQDLSAFVEKSSLRPLDTEVSPAPTDDGYYVVFVEMGRDDDFPKRVIEMCDQVSNLTDIKKWKFKPYKGSADDIYDVNEKNIREHINLDPDKVEVEDSQADQGSPEGQDQEVKVTEQIGSFLGRALIESVEIRGEWIRIDDGRQQRVYRIIGFDKGSPSIPVFGLDIGSGVLSESLQLERMLGPEYEITTADQALIVDDGDNHLILAVDS